MGGADGMLMDPPGGRHAEPMARYGTKTVLGFIPWVGLTEEKGQKVLWRATASQPSTRS
jgi:hypothetical protein